MRRVLTVLAFAAGMVLCMIGGCASKAKPDAAVAVPDAGVDAGDASDVADAGDE